VPTVEGISSIVTYVIGGDPLEMGIVRPWALTKMGPLSFPVPMHSFTRLKGIA